MSQSERAFQQERAQALMPFRATLEREGRTFVWLAKRLTIPKGRLMSYVYGYARIPHDVLERACLILNINASEILSHLEHNHLDRSALLQDAPNAPKRPRTAKTTKTTDETEKAVSHDSSTHDHSRNRNARSSQPSASKPRRTRARRNAGGDPAHDHNSAGGETRAASAAMGGGPAGRGVARAVS